MGGMVQLRAAGGRAFWGAFVAFGLGLAAACGVGEATIGAPDAPGDAGPFVSPGPGGAADAAAPVVGEGGAQAGGDAGAPFAWPDPGPPCAPAAERLSQTCLYADFAARTLRADVVEYRPNFELWSDAASKRRFVWLPPGATIDTSDMDHWKFPVGARLWKEFALDGKVLETRLVERTGPGEGDYRVVAFAWREDGSDADAVPSGRDDVLGTQHDVPSTRTCRNCHDGLPGKVLGFSAVQLSRGGPGVTLDALVANGKLSAPPPGGRGYPVPGSAIERAALGYLHANCGHCHNPSGEAYRFVDQVLFLDVATLALGDPTQTKTYTTTIGKRTTALLHRQSDLRVKAGDHAGSDVWLRMGRRERYFPPPNMPPYGTELVDLAGRDAVAQWIDAL